MDSHEFPPGQSTLTILTAHKPVKLLSHPTYRFAKVEKWRRCSDWVNGLEISMIPLTVIRKYAGGEAMVILQAIIDDPSLQKVVWPELLSRELTAEERLKNVIMAVVEEAFMSIAKVFREGILAGEKELLLRLLERATAETRDFFKPRVSEATDLDQLRELENQILEGTSVELV